MRITRGIDRYSLTEILFALSSILCYDTLYAGGLFGVEKVEPDPLNLAVNTDVGSVHSMKVFEVSLNQQAGFFLLREQDF